MLPEKLSTDLTSLNPRDERLAMVVEMVVEPDGSVADCGTVYRARVSQPGASWPTTAWPPGSTATGPSRRRIDRVPGLADNLRLQDRVAQSHEEPARNGTAP